VWVDGWDGRFRPQKAQFQSEKVDSILKMQKTETGEGGVGPSLEEVPVCKMEGKARRVCRAGAYVPSSFAAAAVRGGN